MLASASHLAWSEGNAMISPSRVSIFTAGLFRALELREGCEEIAVSPHINFLFLFTRSSFLISPPERTYTLRSHIHSLVIFLGCHEGAVREGDHFPRLSYFRPPSCTHCAPRRANKSSEWASSEETMLTYFRLHRLRRAASGPLSKWRNWTALSGCGRVSRLMG